MIPPSFHASVSSSSSNIPNDGMMSINSSHPRLTVLLSPFFSEESSSQADAVASSYEASSILIDEHLIDFACRYHIVVRTESSNDGFDCRKNKWLVLVKFGLVGWDEVRDYALITLRTIFGVMNVNETTLKKVADSQEDLYDVHIKVNSLKVPQGQTLASCLESLCNLRLIILGSRLMNKFGQLSIKEESSSSISKPVGCKSFTIPIQRHYGAHYSMVVSSSGFDRVTVVIPITFHDETDRALARLFLQQFQGAQRKCSAKNAPICDFRRSNDPPRELNAAAVIENTCAEELAGYISFTILDNNQFQSLHDQRKLTNLLMIMDFLDYHVKCSKSYMHMRMRRQHDALLKRLQD